MLQVLFEVPLSATDRARWSLHHSNDHVEIVQAINALGDRLSTYLLDPIPEGDVADWALRHQQYHNDMNTALGLPGQDLFDVDFDDKRQLQAWIWLNAQEHNSVRLKLGI